MKGTMKFFSMLLAVTALGGIAWAEEAAAPVAPAAPARDYALERFKAMDTDADGAVTVAEFKAAQEKRQEEMKKRMGDKFDPAKLPNPEEVFKKLDADANGSLSVDELRKSFGDRAKGGGMGEGQKRRNKDGEKKPEAAPKAAE